ncbi:AraC family transcriptional regulator [Chitinophaga sp. 22321]|uniref:Helix-turn-helix domain-containing protein n=1 Tax=Chitinophaga hostae TaxID=2831022 RepID=A0ABS5IUX5_9BACT|nr:AraC family transcriptional regulator [Chitinophaga hostae]MBS0026683.1 helix-turn-helix domain-containing protein [Chitinophaga hostae]
MKRYIQHEYLKISHFTATAWTHPVHNHNHFELIFIHRGSGTHCISGMNYPYNGPCLFLLAPCDAHHFEIAAATAFTFIKFTNVYLHGSGSIRLQQSWNQELDRLLVQAREKRAFIPETKRMEQLIELVTEEWQDAKEENNETIFFLLQALFTMIKKAGDAELPSPAPAGGARVTEILHYIHEHIHQTEEIQIEQLADIFGYSKYYLGTFFKEQTGSTLREYVNRYKLHLLENRLHYSNFSLKEISYELGFNDQSHLNKFFRKYHDVSPSAYREQVQAS